MTIKVIPCILVNPSSRWKGALSQRIRAALSRAIQVPALRISADFRPKSRSLVRKRLKSC
jgi:hypothetical protein